MVVKTRIIKIGNSQGIRIPKPLLEQSGIEGEVELEVEENRIVIQAATHPRQHWDEDFAAIAKRGDDALLDPDVLESSHEFHVCLTGHQGRLS